MKVLRSFLPVGQGAFYRKAFITKDKDIHNVVYDCGSTSKNLIKSAIDREFHDGDTVDAVFISHFHSDHINGLKHLVERCNVKNIFFPLLTEEEEKGFTKLFCLLEQDDDEDVFAILDNLDNMRNTGEWGTWGAELKNPETKTWFVSNETKDDNLKKDGRNKYVILSKQDCSSKIFSGEHNGSETPDWEYVPFNFRQHEKIEKIKQLIGKEKWGSFMNQISSSSIKDFIKNSNNKNWLKNIKEELQVRKWGGDLNTNSMVVYSGCKNPDLKFQYLYFKEKKICHCCSGLGLNKHTGCLYTGDYDASSDDAWEKLENGFQKYWDRIGCLQIPHHGSSHNYNPKIIDKVKETDCLPFCIVSAGEKNKYDHPHPCVIKDLVMRGCLVDVVTEDKKSQMNLEICE